MTVDMNEEARYTAEVGDYVLATKYSDGDPCDHFVVGFVSGYTWHHRYMIVDNEGNNQRGNGFRRAEKLTADEGRQLVELMPSIGDKRGPSVWWHLSQIRGEGEDRFCESCKYEKEGACRCEEDPSDFDELTEDVNVASCPSRCSALRFLSKCNETSRGFQIITFDDANGKECELQQSSAIDDTERGLKEPGSSYVWLGVGCYSERMHLHREHVMELISVLQGWLKDGKLDS